MKASRVLFISKEGLATFWFLLGATAVIWSAIHVLRQSITAGLRPQYIIMTEKDVIQMVPERDPDKVKEMDLAQTRLLMDSIFNKSPTGLDAEDRAKKLLSDEAWSWVQENLIDKQSEAFRDGRIHQKIEIESIDLHPLQNIESTAAYVHGQLIRTGVAGNRLYNEVWDVRAQLVWGRNVSLRGSGRQPTICESFQCREKALQSTLRRTQAEDGVTAPKENSETPAADKDATATAQSPSN